MKTASMMTPNAASSRRLFFSDEPRLAIVLLQNQHHILHRLKECRHFNRQHNSGDPPFAARSSAACLALLICKVDRVDDQKLFLVLDLIDECTQVRILAQDCESKVHAWKSVQYFVGFLAGRAGVLVFLSAKFQRPEN